MGHATPWNRSRSKPSLNALPPLSLPPLSLYVHVPWCIRKCPYCDFNSHALQGGRVLPAEGVYLEALGRDLEQEYPSVQGRTITTIFIGGGTPSLLSPEGVHRLLNDLRTRLPIADHAEVTLEANPGTVDQVRFTGFKAAGINRLSLGIQSFDDDCLARLGRIHTSDEAIAAFAMAREAGYDNINLDLMFGLPGQDRHRAERDLTTALALAPEHLSYYQLTIEPGTAFYRNLPTLPDEETCWIMQEEGQALLAAAGYVHYEISAYAQLGRRCLHNVHYWEFGDYLGIGAGAHGKVTSKQGIRRRVKHPDPHQYLTLIGSQPVASDDWIAAADLPAEFMINALRLVEGVPVWLYPQRTGLPLATISDKLTMARARGWLEPVEDRLVATPQGRQFLNEVLELFLPDSACSVAAL